MGMNAAQSRGFPPPGVVGSADSVGVSASTAPTLGQGIADAKTVPTPARIPRPVQPTAPTTSGPLQSQRRPSPYISQAVLNNYTGNQRYKFNLDGEFPGENSLGPGVTGRTNPSVSPGYRVAPRFSDLVSRWGGRQAQGY